MEVKTGSKRLKSIKMISLFFLIIASTASSQNTTRCPFQYFYEFGDGLGDIGNSIRILPRGPFLPAARLPYGTTFPGTPTGRWSDGRIEADYAADGVGLPSISPYLSLGSNSSTSHDSVIFSVASSPVLERLFFIKRGIAVKSYATPLASQIKWFRKYLASVSPNPSERVIRVANSLILLVYAESHDIAYPLVQGKSIEQVATYVPSIVDAQIHAIKRFIKMGATRIAISGGGPIGCFPYILTALPSNNASAYDALGCLKSVNALIISYNTALQQAIDNLKTQFPNVTMLYIDDYQASTSVITQMVASGIELRACCGIGGRYNYDSARFCGSPGVPVCDNPNEYIYWDGMHYTQEAIRRISDIVLGAGRLAFNCTSGIVIGQAVSRSTAPQIL